MKDFCIEQRNNPELPALIGEMLGDAGVNIEGLCLTTCEHQSVIHFVVEDAVTARSVLESSGIKIKDVSEVFILNKDRQQITGKSGSFGEISRTLMDNGIIISFGYPAENNRFVFGVDDIAKTLELLE